MKIPERARHELKYSLSVSDADRLFQQLREFLINDPHAGPSGKYEVASIYYDTPEFRFYRDRQESVGYRRKVRVRSYNADGISSGLFLEIKEKHRNFVAKKRTILDPALVTLADGRHEHTPLVNFLAGAPDGEGRREVDYLNRQLDLLPVSIIRYVRRTLVGVHERDIRVTYDERLTTGGSNFYRFESDDELFIQPPGLGILEVKADRTLPTWLTSILSSWELTQTRFSKYCLAVDAMSAQRPGFYLQQRESVGAPGRARPDSDLLAIEASAPQAATAAM